MSLRFFFRQSRNSGETLIEVLISLSILTMVILPASGMIVTSMRLTANDRGNLTASLQAKEGIELMRWIRDENIIRFAADSEKCWDVGPEVAECPTDANGQTLVHIATGSYRLSLDPSESPPSVKLEKESNNTPLDAENPAQFYQLELDDTVATSNGTLPPATGVYTHFRGTPTRMYREIKLTVEPSTDPATNPASKYINVESTVVYFVGSQAKKVVRAMRITNPILP